MSFTKKLRPLLLLSPLLMLAGCNTVVLNASGDVAAQQGKLIVIATVMMLLVIVPVIFLTILFAWRYRHSNKDATYSPDWDHSTALELVIWAVPLLIIIALGAVTWIYTHTLDPYAKLRRIDAQRALPVDANPLVVEVVALDWKWLFIYPEQGIAMVNELAAPVDRQISFKITASSVMNSFFIPSLAGQIYAMPGMETKLHAVMNSPGNYEGFSSNYSGAGYSDMRFRFHGMSHGDFDKWVAEARASGKTLSRDAYVALEKPTYKVPVMRFAKVDPDLYDRILNRCLQPGQTCMTELMDGMEHGTNTMPPKEVAPNAAHQTDSSTPLAIPIEAPKPQPRP